MRPLILNLDCTDCGTEDQSVEVALDGTGMGRWTCQTPTCVAQQDLEVEYAGV